MTAQTIKLIDSACPVCGGTAVHRSHPAVCHCPPLRRPYTYVECTSCGVTYLNPRPTDDSLGTCYNVLETWHRGRPAPASVADRRQPSRLRAWWRGVNRSQPAFAHIGTGPVLDVGCGRGELLAALAARGMAVEGLEFNPEAVEYCRRQGLDVRQGSIESAEFAEGKYGTVVLSHALEHFGDPVQELSKLGRAVAPGGRVVVVVPHLGSPMRRLFGPYWHGWDPPFHLVHYTPVTLGRVAARAGLRLASYRLTMSVEDFTRSLQLKRDMPRRRLFTRVIGMPACYAAELAGLGGVLTAVLHPDRGRTGGAAQIIK